MGIANGLMERNIQDNGRMVWGTGMAFGLLKMVKRPILENGKMEKWQDMGNITKKSSPFTEGISLTLLKMGMELSNFKMEINSKENIKTDCLMVLVSIDGIVAWDTKESSDKEKGLVRAF